MRAPFVGRRLRGASLSTVIPPPTSPHYSSELASIAARIIYKSPLPSAADLPVYILNSAAFPDSKEVSYDKLLPYVLARFPGEDELIGGKGYEVIFFAGGGEERGDSDKKKNRPSMTWTIQAYNVLSRAMRKRLCHLYLVHERRWVRVITEMFSTIVSPKFRRKVTHVSTLSQLALHIPIQDLLIPPSAYYRDRKLIDQIYVPYVTGRRAFKVLNPLPKASNGEVRLPRILREATSFVLAEDNIKTEGLFRINARAVTLDVLKEAYDRGQKFIVWREGQFVMSPHHWKDGFGDVSVHETNEVEGYSVLAAAGLIKAWYSDLNRPIFGESSYQYLERNYSSGIDNELTHEKLKDLLGAESDWSPITSINRQILRMHLLPMLSSISQHPENKMTPKALAVCFAPSLLCGSDPIRDARISGVVSKIIEYAVDQWNKGLRENLGVASDDFYQALVLPSSPEDREDPLEKDTVRPTPNNMDQENQSQGITLVDHLSSASSDEDEEEINSDADSPKPALPPRVRGDSNLSEGAHGNPPRYSTIMGSSSRDTQPSSLITQPFQPPTTSVHRKPTPAQSRTATNDDILTGEITKPEDLTLDRLSLDSGKAFETINSRNDSNPPLESSSLPGNTSTSNSSPTSPTSPRNRTDTMMSSSSGVSRKPVPGH